MKLPIDNFALLGVGLGTDSPGVLRALQKKIEKPGVNCVNEKTLQKRKEILMRASKTLLDKQLREKYEDDLKSNSEKEKGFEVDEEEEVAGLMLLLEEGYSEDCLQLSTEIRFRNGYFGGSSVKERELEMLIDDATLKTAEGYKGRRHYEKAAYIIERRLKEKVGGIGEIKTKDKLEKELIQLRPYLILDLVSRQNSEKKRKFGITLLEDLIKRRGGLDEKSDEVMRQEEFVSFLRQIRMYLTIQEQIDFFQKQGSKGSQIGSFLSGIALTASGFSQRKPERLEEAITVLKEINRNELEPIIGNIYLLLGDIKTAGSKFSTFAEPDLKDWCREITPETLGQMCAWCEEWLRRDVLSGYKDIDMEPDIDAYFNDKDVVEYIEKRDKPDSKARLSGNQEYDKYGESIQYHQVTERRIVRKEGTYQREEFWAELRKLSCSNESLGIISIIAILTGSLALFAQLEPTDGVKKRDKSIIIDQKGISQMMTRSSARNESEVEKIESTISNWHTIKKNKLAGKEIPKKALDFISRKRLIELEKEAERLKKKGMGMNINVEIRDMKIIEKSESQLIVDVLLDYSERITNNNGKIIREVPRKLFRRTYKLIKVDKGWVID